MEPLFPIRGLQVDSSNAVFAIESYRHDGAWVFDDERVGLVREPFVPGITEMIDRLVAHIPNAELGFRLHFAAQSFDGVQTRLIWKRADPVEGNWYGSEESAEEGWLCPALFCYFAEAPKTIYLRAEAIGPSG